MLISRSDRGLIANWWFTVDRLLLSAVCVLIAAGVLFSMAASPPVAARLGLDHFHFFDRQLLYVFPALAVMTATSMLDLKTARRLCLAIFAAGIALMVAAILTGPEIKGAHRWIDIGPINLQPSEIVKPAFVVMVAWFLAEAARRPDTPGLAIAWGLLPTTSSVESLSFRRHSPGSIARTESGLQVMSPGGLAVFFQATLAAATKSSAVVPGFFSNSKQRAAAATSSKRDEETPATFCPARRAAALAIRNSPDPP